MMSWAWVHRSIGKTRSEQVLVGRPAAGDLRGQRRGRPGVHDVRVADEAARLAALVLVVPPGASRRRVDRQLGLGGHQRVVVVGLALVVERVPDREGDAEEALTADQPVAVEAARPSCRSGASCAPGIQVISAPRASISARSPRRGHRCGCTTAGWRRSRAACRPARRSSPSAGWASAPRRGHRSRAARPPSARAR